jgi:hypothetical protein
LDFFGGHTQQHVDELMKKLLVVSLVSVLIGACSEQTPPPRVVVKLSEQTISVYGHWIREADGSVMQDSQPSGLISWRDKLVTLSDRSAILEQRLRLHLLNPQSAQLENQGMQMTLADNLSQSCFASYLSDNPDLEALVGDPQDDTVFYMVTEDASYAAAMSAECRAKYLDSGATEYPILLVRMQIVDDSSVHMTHVRPIQYTRSMQVGNFPNDGIEALAFGQNRTLYLGLEKDINKQARVFTVHMDNQFWLSDDFAQVSEPKLKLPQFEHGNHPINGMDYYQTDLGKEFLIASARNDESLWIIDLAGERDTRIIKMEFYAELNADTDNCQDWEKMDNASIEGVAVMDETLWMVNDPWKEVYKKNIICSQNRVNYEQYSPLLFSVAIEPSWFE